MTRHSQFNGNTSLSICDDDVVRFLKEQPEFFLRQLDLLVHLQIPHPQRGAISLIEIQLEKLRERVLNLEEEITTLMSIAAGNGNLFRVFSIAHRALFDANSKNDIYHALDALAASLNLSVSLRLYEPSSDLQETTTLERSAVDRLKASHFCGQRIYLGRLRKLDGEQFVTPAPELGSYALLPVSSSKEFGFLSFSSKDGGHFQPSMDTLFVEQIAEHIAILLAKWSVSQ